MTTLLEEIQSGPLASACAPFVLNGDDGAIAKLFNNKTIDSVGMISTNIFAMWCGSTGLRATIQHQADDNSSPLQAISLTILDLLRGNLDKLLDFSSPVNQGMLQTYTMTGAITQEQQSELLALAAVKISYAESLNKTNTTFPSYITPELVAQTLRPGA